jgi:hypothetical protein
MRVGVWFSEKVIDTRLADAFSTGCAAHGEDIVRYDLDAEVLPPMDAAFIFGVKSRVRADRLRAAGVHTVYFDKGYVRTTVPGPSRKECLFWRVAVDSHHPTGYLPRMRSPSDRWESLGLTFAPWRESGSQVVIAGSSAKYHEFSKLPHPTKYTAHLVKQIARLTDRRIVYRPKPSWQDAVPVEGAAFSTYPEKLSDAISGAHVLVTNGSNSCFEAVLAGVPCVVLGVAAPISSTSLSEIEEPRLASDAERWQWLADLAYSQWTMEELRSGEAWTHIRRLIDGQ